MELVLSHANRLQGTPFGVNRDSPQEIIAARKPLFKEKKSLKVKQPNSSISIQYPAKLIIDDRVGKDMFPDWFKIMKCDRLDSKLGSIRTEPLNTQTGQSEQVFDSDPDYSDTNSENEQIEMATESNDKQSRGSFSQQESQTSNGVRFSGSTPRGRTEPMDSSERNVGSAISTEVSSNATERRPPALNVCGIKRKLLYHELCEIISDYDLFCVTETKIDNNDIINLPGYKFLSQCRKQKYLRISGGIGVFVKENIFPFVHLIESDSDYILWIKLSKSFLHADEDFIFRVVYLPPSDSRFNNPNEIELFEVETTNMCILYKNVFLIGDFNARTPTKQEFIDADDFFAEHFGYDDTLNQFYSISSMLSQFNFDKSRVENINQQIMKGIY